MPRYGFSGGALRSARERSGRTRSELAVAIGRSERTVTGYELGTIIPTAHMVGVLAAAVDVTPGDLFELAVAS